MNTEGYYLLISTGLPTRSNYLQSIVTEGYTCDKQPATFAASFHSITRQFSPNPAALLGNQSCYQSELLWRRERVKSQLFFFGLKKNWNPAPPKKKKKQWSSL